jgi:hypothetical protein
VLSKSVIVVPLPPYEDEFWISQYVIILAPAIKEDTVDGLIIP